MKKMTIVFQGDSITDAGRNREDPRNLGSGYAKYAAEAIEKAFPEVEFDFINQGIGGNRTSQLFDRLYNHAIVFEPNIISLLIGINDIWHRNNHIETSDAQIELNYRSILESIKRNTNAKILMMSPYVLDGHSASMVRDGLPSVIAITEKLAAEFADAYIPLDRHFAEALKNQPEPLYYSADGVHPSENGKHFIAKYYVEAITPLIKELI